MDINIMWDNEQWTVIRCAFTQNASSDDLGAIQNLAAFMLDSVDDVNEVALIVDVTASSGVGRVISNQFLRFFADLHPKVGPVFLIGAKPPSRRGVTGKLTGLLNKSEPVEGEFYYVTSLQEARGKIKRLSGDGVGV